MRGRESVQMPGIQNENWYPLERPRIQVGRKRYVCQTLPVGGRNKSSLDFCRPGNKVVHSPAEMLSIYPTLLDLCGLEPYERNEGDNLGSLLRGETKTAEEFALTTYGWGNHGIRTENYRYIRYMDRSEEFYDYLTDPNEWHNLTQNQKIQSEMESLKKYLPEKDAPYAKHSVYNFNPYFANDKLRISN